MLATRYHLMAMPLESLGSSKILVKPIMLLSRS
jgi:hypothetical protein